MVPLFLKTNKTNPKQIKTKLDNGQSFYLKTFTLEVEDKTNKEARKISEKPGYFIVFMSEMNVMQWELVLQE